MKIKRAILRVEPTKISLNRVFSVMKSRTPRFKGCFVINFPDFETMGKVLTGTRLSLLAALRDRRPKSIQELAKIVERDFKNVYQDIIFLEEFGLVTLDRTGVRRPSNPRAAFDELVLAA